MVSFELNEIEKKDNINNTLKKDNEIDTNIIKHNHSISVNNNNDFLMKSPPIMIQRSKSKLNSFGTLKIMPSSSNLLSLTTNDNISITKLNIENNKNNLNDGTISNVFIESLAIDQSKFATIPAAIHPNQLRTIAESNTQLVKSTLSAFSVTGNASKNKTNEDTIPKTTNVKRQMKRKQTDIGKTYKPKIPFLIISSQSKFRLTWDILTLCWLFYFVMATPFYYGFRVEPTIITIYFERMLDIFFIMDVILNFRTGFFLDDNPREIFDSKIIMKNYIFTWFLADFISSIPSTLLVSLFPTGTGENVARASKLVKAVRLIRIAKLIRLLNMSKYMDIIDHHFTITRNGLQLLKLLLSAIVISHINACMFFLVSTTTCDRELYYKDHSVCSSLNELYGKSNSEQYIHSFYWSITTLTTIGYGDISPRSTSERLYGALTMIIGSGFYSYVIASMANHVNKLDMNKQLYNEKMDQIKSYMNCRSLPKELKKRIKLYYKYYLTTKTSLNENEILSELSTSLRHEVVAHLVHDAVFQNVLFRSTDPHCISQLTKILKPISCGSNETLIEQNEYGRDMYILLRGKMDVYHDDILVKTLIDGDSFGELAVLDIESKRALTVISRGPCELYCLSREDFQVSFEDYPAEIRKMKEIANKYSIDKTYTDILALQHIHQAVSKEKFIATAKMIMMNEQAIIKKRKKETKRLTQSRNSVMIDPSMITKNININTNNNVLDIILQCQKLMGNIQLNILCVDCQSETRSVLFLPCNHIVCCKKCGIIKQECPFCDEKINKNGKIEVSFPK